MSDDWETVTVLTKKNPKSGPVRSAQAINAAMRQGVPIETSKKWAGGQNKQHLASKDTAKLDRETDELHHETVPLTVAKAIQQARQAKGITQKDLATKINEKPNIITDYEAARAIPNQQILSKLERELGVKLRGREIGQPLAPKK